MCVCVCVCEYGSAQGAQHVAACRRRRRRRRRGQQASADGAGRARRRQQRNVDGRGSLCSGASLSLHYAATYVFRITSRYMCVPARSPSFPASHTLPPSAQYTQLGLPLDEVTEEAVAEFQQQHPNLTFPTAPLAICHTLLHPLGTRYLLALAASFLGFCLQAWICAMLASRKQARMTVASDCCCTRMRCAAIRMGRGWSEAWMN